MTWWIYLVGALILGATGLLIALIAGIALFVADTKLPTAKRRRPLHPFAGLLFLGAYGVLVGLIELLEATTDQTAPTTGTAGAAMTETATTMTGAIGPPTADPLAVVIYWTSHLVVPTLQYGLLAAGVLVFIVTVTRYDLRGAAKGSPGVGPMRRLAGLVASFSTRTITTPHRNDHTTTHDHDRSTTTDHNPDHNQ